MGRHLLPLGAGALAQLQATGLDCPARSAGSGRSSPTSAPNVIQSLINGNTTLAVLVGAEPRADSEILATLPMVWIGGRRWAQRDTQPVPLAVFEPPCWFRSAAITALDEAGIPWRVAFTSPSLSGIGAAIDAGLRIIVRTEASVPEKLVALDESAGLPKLP